MLMPSSNISLLSISRFNKAGCRTEFVNGRCTISDAKTDKIILTGTLQKNLYFLDNVNIEAASQFPMKVYHTTNAKITLDLMHQRLGHLNTRSVKQLFKKDMVHGLTLSEKHLKAAPSICECCVQGKMQQTPLPKRSSCKTAILNLAHSDLWGPSPVKPRGGSYYFISFTDDSSQYSWIRYLHKKSNAFAAFKEWHLEVERQTGRKLWIFRSNNGGEYITVEWELYLKERGIVHQKSTPRTLEQNGVSERLNLTLMDHVHTILIESQLPLSLWAEAVEYSIYTKNRSPTAAIKDKTPYEAFWGKKPDISNLHVFGSQCYVHNDAPSRRKFDDRAIPTVFISYSTASKAWKYYILAKQKVGTSRNIIFNKRPQSSVLHHNIEGELAAMKSSTYRDLLVADPNSESNVDDDDSASPKPRMSTQTVELMTAPPNPTLPPSPTPSPSPPSPVLSPPMLQLTPVQPTDPPSKPKQRVRGPAKIYEKSRSSQHIEDRNKPKSSPTQTMGDPNGPESESDSADEAQICDELEPKHSEFTQTTAYVTTGQDPDSYKEAIDSVDHDEWQAAM